MIARNKIPWQSRFLRLFAFALAILAIFWSVGAHADVGIMDRIAESYESKSGDWLDVLSKYARSLFFLLAVIELAWSGAVWVLEKKDLEAFTAGVVKKIMWLSMFYALLTLGPDWIPRIIASFTEAGATASGVPKLSPSEVFSTGINNASIMLAGTKDMGLFKDFATIVIAGLSAIMIVLSFAVISAQLLIALVESYIVVSAGMLFLGFGGSRWTTDFVQKFIGYAFATGVKLFMLYLIIGIGNTQAAKWGVDLAKIGTPAFPFLDTILSVLGGSVLLAYLAVQIPSMAASMLSGSPTLTAGGAATTGGMAGAAIVGAGAAGAASTLSAAKSSAGVATAAKAAWGEAGAQGAFGAGRAMATLGNMGTAAATNAGTQLAGAVAQTTGGRMADISTARAAETTAAKTAPPAPQSPATAFGTGFSAPGPGSSAVPSAGSNQAPGDRAGRSPPAPPQGTVGESQPAPAGGANTSKDTQHAAGVAGGALGMQEQAQGQKAPPTLADSLREMQQVRPPQLPSDAAASATANIKFDTDHD